MAISLSPVTSVFALALLTSTLHAQGLLAPPTTLTDSLFWVSEVVTLDANSDGAPDVLALDQQRSRLKVYFNGADGPGSPAVVLGTYTDPIDDLLAHDFDGDGDEDLVGVQANSLVWFESAGGQLLPLAPLGGAGMIPPASFSRELHVADMDGDGREDVLCGAYWYRRLSGNQLAPPVALLTGDPAIFGLVPLDVEGDGDLDLAYLRRTSSTTGQVICLENLGAWPSSASHTIASTLGQQISPLKGGDVDGDGRVDLAYATSGGETVIWNDGSLTFASSTLSPVTSGIQELFFEDMDADGDLDLLASSYLQGRTHIRTNLGARVFGQRQVMPSGAESSLSMAIDDFDQDGWLDVCAAGADNLLGWFRHTGAPGQASFEPERFITTAFDGPAVPVVADFDSDGREDLALIDHGRDLLMVGLSGGEADRVWTTIDDASDKDPRTLLASDLDADGNIDLLFRGGDDEVHAYLGRGDGTFAAPVTSLFPGINIWDLAEPVDVTGDGFEDAIISYPIQTHRVAALPGDGMGGFGAPIDLWSGSRNFTSVRMTDLDGDGLRDAVCLQMTNPSIVQCRMGTVGGGFGAPFSPPTTRSAASFLLEDLDGDGVQDLFVQEYAGSPSWALRWYALGNGAFGAGQPVPSAGPNVFPRAFVDLDMDGDRDLLFIHSQGGLADPRAVHVAERLAVGTLATPMLESAGLPGASDFVAVDLDDDADEDLYWVSGLYGDAGFVENLSSDRVGTAYCGPAVPNSTGAAGLTTIVGSADVQRNALTLRAWDLPANATTLFLCSQAQALVFPVVGSLGALCLGAPIGRYVGPGQVGNSGTTGFTELAIDLQQMPTPTGLVQALPGETWSFQAWHRDAIQGVPTSNFTEGAFVLLR